MNSQSETFRTGNDANAEPVPLLGRERRKREVLRLQFYALGQKSGDASGEKVEAEQTDAELQVRQDLAALNAKLLEQAEVAAVRMEDAVREAQTRAREEWESELAERIGKERDNMLRVCEEFQRERAQYFSSVESEVVKLALAIAARVLHREAKLDPLLLSAVVRVALEKVAEQSGVALRVPSEDWTAWREIFGEGINAELIADGTLSTGECVLETKVGRVDLGVSAQLTEIERGFFDLLQRRPV